MTDESTSEIERARHNAPTRIETDCDRCGAEIVVIEERRGLCDDCEDDIADLKPPSAEGREITPMDRRWR